MKALLLILGLSTVLILFWSCHQNSNLGSTVSLAESKKDSVAPDSLLVMADSLILETVETDSIVLREPYEQIFFENTLFSVKVLVYEVKLDTAEINLIDNKYKGLNHAYKTHPQNYLMMTNGGMFHPKGIPVGLFINETKELTSLNLDIDNGNFFLLPNGVFFVTCDNIAGVLETKTFIDSIYNKETSLKLATQSGPMLVVNGKHHPKFEKNSPNKNIRSGIGVTDDQTLIFILSKEEVNFYTFASIFLEKGCKNALYLDGAISDMYIKDMGDDIINFNTRFGPVIGVFSQVDSNVVKATKIGADTIPTTNSIKTKDEK